MVQEDFGRFKKVLTVSRSFQKVQQLKEKLNDLKGFKKVLSRRFNKVREGSRIFWKVLKVYIWWFNNFSLIFFILLHQLWLSDQYLKGSNWIQFVWEGKVQDGVDYTNPLIVFAIKQINALERYALKLENSPMSIPVSLVQFLADWMLG